MIQLIIDRDLLFKELDKYKKIIYVAPYKMIHSENGSQSWVITYIAGVEE